MRHRILEFVFVLVFLFVTIFNMIGMVSDAFNYDLTDLPKGHFLYSTMSPDGISTVRLYRVDVPNIGVGIRGEVITTENGENVTKNIYWQTNARNALATWVNDTHISINNKHVNIHGAVYDSRTEVELPEASVKNLLKQ